ncbi:DUF2270 domain-containing protein [Methylobacterium nodulans]|uniref:Conserved hypothetical membrane protein n=1 Tax=Methylobacterium nodulans (strain LMG 21967 / CNCM I-2342 / ORS 2060) TaxID=460265 RepID=B8IA29_METNO|nr:DUF2270 domain-containing protein [Methylobacterium nodulans]ACL57257.1 conserved hypothetical membrane protein [Methylobacterium nodulans ORS 2060]
MSLAANTDLGQSYRSGSPSIPLPQTASEITTVIAHYYRGEIARATGWRDRIDRTTNWAITLIGAMLSVSLAAPVEQHGILLFAMMLLLVFLIVEARRYRYFDVYRVRLRQLERHYLAQIFAPTQEKGADWTFLVAEDLRRPVFLMTYMDALTRRLRRNYLWMFLILLSAWILKIASAGNSSCIVPVQPASLLQKVADRAALGPLPGQVIVVVVCVLYGALLIQACRPSKWSMNRDDGQVHV